MQELARQLAAQLAPDALLDADDVGLMLKCSGRHVLEWHAKAPGFPKPKRLPGPNDSTSHPRWQRKQITEYLENVFTEEIEVKSGQPGRPRRRRGVTA